MNRLTERINGVATCTERYEMRSPCHYCEYQSTDDCSRQNCTYALIIDELARYEDIGKPEELGKVVRCKDCESYFVISGEDGKKSLICVRTNTSPEPDFYCGWGEILEIDYD